jgi:hypothetical protein
VRCSMVLHSSVTCQVARCHNNTMATMAVC